MSELETVLRLVADGSLTADEAAPLIDAVMGRGAEPPPVRRSEGRRAHQLRIKVTEHGRQVVNLRIPLGFAEMAGRMVPGLSAEHWDRIRDAVSSNVTGPIVDVEDENGDGVLISVD